MVRGGKTRGYNTCMKHDPDRYHRRSIRLKGYDYSQAGAIEIDEFVVMPNHFHGIIIIVGAPLVGAHFPNADNT